MWPPITTGAGATSEDKGTQMSERVGQWRATYTPGDWVVLSGPTSVVLLEPAAPEWSTLINTIWESVLASASMSELAAVLAQHRIEEMPSFGAFFWTGAEMRSLVRGSVTVVDLATGDTVATGEGVQTWTEVGLDGVEQVRIDLQEMSGSTLLQLPLVVGAVTASSLVLDASADAQVHSPQLEDSKPQRALEEDVAPDEVSWEQPAATEPTEYPRRPVLPDSAPSEVLAPVPAETPPAPAVEPTVGLGHFDRPDYEVPMYQPEGAAEAPVEEEEDNADTALMGITGPPPGPERTVVAVLRATTGESAEVDRAVLVGRSPSPDRATADPHPRLMAVPSPGHDISRSHLQVEPQGWQVEVTDLHSTNGTLLVLPGSEMGPQRLDPGEPVTVPIGCRLDLGDGVSITVEQPSGA